MPDAQAQLPIRGTRTYAVLVEPEGGYMPLVAYRRANLADGILSLVGEVEHTRESWEGSEQHSDDPERWEAEYAQAKLEAQRLGHEGGAVRFAGYVHSLAPVIDDERSEDDC